MRGAGGGRWRSNRTRAQWEPLAERSPKLLVELPPAGTCAAGGGVAGRTGGAATMATTIPPEAQRPGAAEQPELPGGAATRAAGAVTTGFVTGGATVAGFSAGACAAGGAVGRGAAGANSFFALRNRLQHIPGTGNVRQINFGLDFFFAAKRARTRLAQPGTNLPPRSGGTPVLSPLRALPENWSASSSPSLRPAEACREWLCS